MKFTEKILKQKIAPEMITQHARSEAASEDSTSFAAPFIRASSGFKTVEMLLACFGLRGSLSQTSNQQCNQHDQDGCEEISLDSSCGASSA
jgi:hypothetical protein